ncbi:MAG: glycosyltransferase [Bacilli bacterium]|nr:glycosyltransferase [Bacilli bacterium]
MNSKKKVSIIIPVYGVEKYIAKCLDSLVNQTLDDIEIIVVNDGSPDNSQKIIDKYVKKYPDKVKSYIKENGGQGSARNYGIKYATGEYVGYVDSDDYVEKDMYKKLYDKAKVDDLDIVVCGSYNVVEETENKVVDLDKIIFDDKKLNSFFGRMAVWNKIYKKKLVENMKFRSKVWYEDLDFTVNVLSKAKKVDYVNEPFYDYLIREGSTMNNSNIERNLEILLAFDEIKDNKKYSEIIEFLAVDHIYISAVVRVINADGDKIIKKDTINKLINYVDTNFANYKKNKYLYLLSRNRRIIYNLIKFKQYWLINLIFKVKGRDK